MYCANCGTKNDESAKFCVSCGEMLNTFNTPEQNEQWDGVSEISQRQMYTQQQSDLNPQGQGPTPLYQPDFNPQGQGPTPLYQPDFSPQRQGPAPRRQPGFTPQGQGPTPLYQPNDNSPGQSQEPRDQPALDPSFQGSVQQYQTHGDQESDHLQKPKKSNAKTIVVAAVIFVVLFGLGIFGASRIFARDFAMLTMGPEKYAQTYITSGLEKMIDYCFDYAEYYLQSVEDNYYLDSSIIFDVSDAYLDRILQGTFDNDAAMRDLVYMIGQTTCNTVLNYQLKNDKLKLSMNNTFSVRDKKIVSLSASMDDSIFFSIPEVYPDTFEISPESLGLNGGLSFSNLLFMSNLSSSDLDWDHISDLAKYIPELRLMLKEMVNAAVSELDFEVEKNISVDINGQTFTAHAATTKLTESQMNAAAAAALKVLRDNDDYLLLLANIANHLSITDSGDPYTAQSMRDKMGYLINETESVNKADNETVKYKIFIDQSNNMIGQSMASSDSEIIIAWSVGKGYTFKVEADDLDFSVYGDLIKSSDTYSGTIRFDDGNDGKIGEFSDVKFVKYHGVDLPTGVFSFEVKDWLDFGGADMSNDFAALLKDLKGSVLIAVEDELGICKINIDNGTDARIGLEYSSRQTKSDLSIIKPTNAVEFDASDPLSAIDKTLLLEGVKKVFDKLKEAGYDFDEFYNLLELSLSFNSGNYLDDYDYGDYDFSDFNSTDYDLGNLDPGDYDLGNLDLSDLDLGDINLNDIDLSEIDLSQLDLDALGLGWVRQSGIDLSQIDLSKIDLGAFGISEEDLKKALQQYQQ